MAGKTREPWVGKLGEERREGGRLNPQPSSFPLRLTSLTKVSRGHAEVSPERQGSLEEEHGHGPHEYQEQNPNLAQAEVQSPSKG